MNQERVKLVEVGPRDGLQNEPTPIPTAQKKALIEKLAWTGLQTIEATSFVSPKWVPQMADHAELLQSLERLESVNLTALVPNERGLENALSFIESEKLQEVAVFAAASETFSQKNTNCSIQESLARFKPIFATCAERNIPVRAYISCIAGCPYEGDIAPDSVAKLTDDLLNLGAYEISLGDTIGVATPRAIHTVLNAIDAPMDKIALHCHDTYGMAVANIYAGLEKGVRTFDASIAGLGGCPYAPGASGNVAMEKLVYLMEKEGFLTGVSLDRIRDIAKWVRGELRKTL